MRYNYVAVFEKEEDGYSVYFPDLEGCYTCGDTLDEALTMAEDALPFYLCHKEDCREDIPPASPIENFSPKSEGFTSYITADTAEYRRKTDGRAVKKTLTVPSWLNEAAISAGVNFSQVLQEALKEKLDIA